MNKKKIFLIMAFILIAIIIVVFAFNRNSADNNSDELQKEDSQQLSSNEENENNNTEEGVNKKAEKANNKDTEKTGGENKVSNSQAIDSTQINKKDLKEIKSIKLNELNESKVVDNGFGANVVSFNQESIKKELGEYKLVEIIINDAIYTFTQSSINENRLLTTIDKKTAESDAILNSTVIFYK